MLERRRAEVLALVRGGIRGALELAAGDLGTAIGDLLAKVFVPITVEVSLDRSVRAAELVREALLRQHVALLVSAELCSAYSVDRGDPFGSCRRVDGDEFGAHANGPFLGKRPMAVTLPSF
jgi:hypothetical protein